MRLFVGIPIPEPVRSAVAAARDRLSLASGDWRLAREEGLHVTIRFAGEIDPGRRAALEAGWLEAAAGTGPVPLLLGGFGGFPSASRPRFVWLSVHDRSGRGALADLARRIEAASRAEGLAPEPRPFSPHLTLARARRGARPRLDRLPDEGEVGRFVAERLVVYSSHPGSEGARYVEEASLGFGEGKA